MDDTSRLLPHDNDFRFLHELKSFLLVNLRLYLDDKLDWTESGLRVGIYTTFADGRRVRIVLPKNKFESRSLLGSGSPSDNTDGGKTLCFVGFIGYSRPKEELSDEFVKKLWDFDEELMAELPNQKHVMAYVTAEREHGGNWGNVVLCNSPKAIEEWRDFHYHSRAILEISPVAYTHIRIHRGILEEGLTTEKFQVEQTIFLDYGAKCTGECHSRTVTQWNTHESSCYFETLN